MILRKYMSLLGIGSAKIDLILQEDTYKPGEMVHGYFLIKGGTIEQQLKRIECDLVMVDTEADEERIMDTVTILTSTLIESQAANQISLTFRLPDSARPSSETLSYRFKTRLVFSEGVESIDQDAIKIV
ncbi:sporulation protein [Mesobacillus foraminis]|uniref:sporulation protein n=1 Tax=Mesobacillus foraminis TaxID=279826 RepID=UPI001BEA9E25|nr:sporulation protein [Mesobacillus foraminis]MBT2758749.1 sporulation protein [Mesobacillus foraminis]